MDYGRDELLSLPLFLGMGKSEMDEIQEKVTIISAHARRGLVLAKRGEACNRLTIITKGIVNCRTYSDDGTYFIDEILHAPLIIQPERIFGLYQRYASEFTAQSMCEVMNIEKNMVIRLMDISMTFRINLLNIVTTANQRLMGQFWRQQSEDIEQRIIRFVKDRCTYPAGHKIISIQMNTMARELGCSRLEVSNALHELEGKELIKIHRGAFEVPMLQLLIGK